MPDSQIVFFCHLKKNYFKRIYLNFAAINLYSLCNLFCTVVFKFILS